MNFATQASAQPRPLLSAALTGAGVGLGLGAIFMMGGMGRAVADHAHVTRIAEAAGGGFSEAALQRQARALGPGGLRLVQDADPAVPAFDSHESIADVAAADPAAVRPGVRDSVRDLNCLTQAVYFEARGESAKGQAAVAQVVLNRVKSPVFPKTVCAVVYQGAASHGCQFSFACDGSMRRGLEPDAWERARHVAARALSGVVLADIGSATHFHTTSVAPAWGGQMLRVAQVGLHVFYRFNPHAPAYRAPGVERAVFVSLPADASGPGHGRQGRRHHQRRRGRQPERPGPAARARARAPRRGDPRRRPLAGGQRPAAIRRPLGLLS